MVARRAEFGHFWTFGLSNSTSKSCHLEPTHSHPQSWRGAFATVELVFGNLRANKGLNGFSLRGRHKVDGQWKLYCLVHNNEKLAHNGYAKQEVKAR